MKLPSFTYHRPGTVDEALALLAEHGPDAKVLAGGQSLLPVMALRLASPAHLVDICRLDELHRLDRDDGHLVIGATVRHSEVEDSGVVADAAPLISMAMPFVAHRAIRSRGTVCGSLAHGDPAAELPAAALALDATMVAASLRGVREIPAREFYETYLTTVLEPDELLVEVRIPARRITSGETVRELNRRHGDYAVVGVAAEVCVDDGHVTELSVAGFGVGVTPVRFIMSGLVGAPADALLFERAGELATHQVDPPDDNHGSADYRRHVTGVLVVDAVEEAAARAAAREAT